MHHTIGASPPLTLTTAPRSNWIAQWSGWRGYDKRLCFDEETKAAIKTAGFFLSWFWWIYKGFVKMGGVKPWLFSNSIMSLVKSEFATCLVCYQPEGLGTYLNHNRTKIESLCSTTLSHLVKVKRIWIISGNDTKLCYIWDNADTSITTLMDSCHAFLHLQYLQVYRNVCLFYLKLCISNFYAWITVIIIDFELLWRFTFFKKLLS